MSERRNTTIGFTMSAVLILLTLGSNSRSARSEAMYNVTYLAPLEYTPQTAFSTYLSYIKDPSLISDFKAGSFDGAFSQHDFIDSRRSIEVSGTRMGSI